MSYARVVAAVVIVLVACLSPAARAGEDDGKVDGAFTYNENEVNLPYVYVWAEEEGFYDEADPTWTLLFVEKPIEERDLGDTIWDSAYIELGITKTAEFSYDDDDAEPVIQVYSQSIRHSADQGGNSSGGTYPEIEITQAGPERFVGRVFHDGPQEMFDDTFFYEFAFDAPLSDPNAPIGDLLPQGGGEPGAAYLAWCDAIHSGDVDAIKALVTDEQAAMLDDPEILAGFAADLEFMQAMTPKNIRVNGGSSDGETAILDVTGEMDGEAVTGEITLTREEGKWITAGESWQ